MIDDERIPGWLNFLLLVVFYSFVFYVSILFLEWMEKIMGDTRIVKAILLFAGAYLAKRKYYWQDGRWIRRFF